MEILLHLKHVYPAGLLDDPRPTRYRSELIPVFSETELLCVSDVKPFAKSG